MQCTLGRKQGEVSEFGEGGNMSVLSVEGRGGGGWYGGGGVKSPLGVPLPDHQPTERGRDVSANNTGPAANQSKAAFR